MQTKTHYHPLCDVKIKEINVTLGEIEESEVVHTLAHAVATVTLAVALEHVDSKHLAVNGLMCKLRQTFGD